MAKLPFDVNEFSSSLDLSNIEKASKDAGILARQFQPIPVSYTGNQFLSVNGGTGFRLFEEGKEEVTKNKKKRGDASAVVRTIPCITLHDFIVFDEKLLRIYGADGNWLKVADTDNAEAIAAWRQSDSYRTLQEVVQAAIIENAARAIDFLGFYGQDAYGTDIPQIEGAIKTTNVATDSNASTAFDYAADLVGNPSLAGASASFRSALRKSESEKTSGANNITFGDFDYSGIFTSVADTVDSNSAFVYSSNAFKWGIAGRIQEKLFDQAELSDGTNLALSDQVAIRADIYVGGLWNLDKVAKAELKSTTK